MPTIINFPSNEVRLKDRRINSAISDINQIMAPCTQAQRDEVIEWAKNIINKTFDKTSFFGISVEIDADSKEYFEKSKHSISRAVADMGNQIYGVMWFELLRMKTREVTGVHE